MSRILWLTLGLAAALIATMLVAACAGGATGIARGPEATTGRPTLTATPSPAPPTAARTNTATATGSPTAMQTATPSPTARVTLTATATATASATARAAPTSGPTPDGVARTLRVPILMYHYISEPPADADVYRRDLSVSPAAFDEHLAYLQDAGYQVITLDDLLYALTQGHPLPPKPVILTFDDGYVDNYTNAFPMLKKRGITGEFFIITDFVNQGREGYMTWPQIEEMAAAGQRFGAHSRDHPDLSGQPVDYLVWQALGSKEAIEEHLGYHPRWIAYPSGKYDQQTIDVFRSADYWGGLTIQQGATHTLDGIFELKRVRVRGSHTAADLAVLLAQDW